MSLPAFGDVSSLPRGDAWPLSGSASGGITKRAGSARRGHGDDAGQGWLLVLQQHVEYDLLRGDDKPSSKECSGSPVFRLSIPAPPLPAASHRRCPRLGGAVSQPSSRLPVPNPLLGMEQIKDKGQCQGVSQYF